MDVPSVKDNLLLEEFKEAWLHYRHIEQMRIRHLAFFFAAYLAGLAAFAALGKTDPSELQLIAVVVFSFILVIIGAFVYYSIRAWKAPMFHYEHIFTRVRLHVYGDKFPAFNGLFNVRCDYEVQKSSPKGTIQKNAEKLVLALLVTAFVLGFHFLSVLYYASRP